MFREFYKLQPLTVNVTESIVEYLCTPCCRRSLCLRDDLSGSSGWYMKGPAGFQQQQVDLKVILITFIHVCVTFQTMLSYCPHSMIENIGRKIYIEVL